MTDVIVTRSGLNKWHYSPPVEWPEKEKVNFYAVSPDSIDFSVNMSWHTTIKYKSPGDQDLIIATNFDARPTSGNLKLNFRHALAKIEAAVRTSRSDIEVRLHSVAIRNVARYGDFFYPETSTTNNGENVHITDCWKTYGNWDYYPLFKIEDGYEILTGTPLKADNKNISFFIPCPLDDIKYQGYFSGSMLELSYQLADRETGKILWPDDTAPHELRDISNPAFGLARLALNTDIPQKRWESGKIYRYTVTLDNPSTIPATRSRLSSIMTEVSVSDYQ